MHFTEEQERALAVANRNTLERLKLLYVGASRPRRFLVV